MNRKSRQFPACSHADRAGSEKRRARKTFFARLCDEPFRLFFPAGLLASICGVTLWPLLYAGALPYAPHIPHARVMIEGFFGAFIVGFMGTAMPRMLSAPRLTGAEVGALFALYLGAVVSHLAGNVALGDGFFLFLLAGFLSALGARFLFLRRDLPPPGFVLASMGLLGAAVAAAMLLAESFAAPSPVPHRFATLLLYQGFVLFPILGVGTFLFPRFIGWDRSGRPARSWKTRATMAAVCGVLLVASFWVEATGHVSGARIFRVAVAGAYLLNEVPLFRRTGKGATLGFSLKVAATMVAFGMLATALFPLYQKGYDHLFLVGGFGLIALTVASRVILGHGDRIDLAESRSRPMQWVIWIIIIAALTRASADPLPQIAVSHHIYAALLWVIAAVIWGVWAFPRLREGEK